MDPLGERAARELPARWHELEPLPEAPGVLRDLPVIETLDPLPGLVR